MQMRKRRITYTLIMWNASGTALVLLSRSMRHHRKGHTF